METQADRRASKALQIVSRSLMILHDDPLDTRENGGIAYKQQGPFTAFDVHFHQIDRRPESCENGFKRLNFHLPGIWLFNDLRASLVRCLAEKSPPARQTNGG